MQSAARRAFLRGRRTPASPWETFCQRLRLVVTGHVYVLEPSGDTAGTAWLTPRHAADVHHAHRLCRTYGVTVALDHGAHAGIPTQHPTLWIDPAPDLARCERLQPGGTAWFVQPGCLLSQLDALGLPGFDQMPGYLTVAAWLAHRGFCQWGTGQTALSGVTHVCALLADGSSAVLGPFGAQQQTPLTTATQRDLVSALFALTMGEDAQHCLSESAWPARYRLDALCPRTDTPVNLAHLLLGHGGQLAWVEWVVLDERLLGQQSQGGGVLWRAGCDPVVQASAQALDVHIKALWDAHGLFAAYAATD